jgi:type VI secretion system FHA domain protein
MRLKLDLSRNDGQPITSLESQTLDRRGITIGRAPDNDWILEDPGRHVSKHHCTIEYRDGEYVLMDTSTNGVFLNRAAERLERNRAVALADGDILGSGVYEIAVRMLDDEPLAVTEEASDRNDPFADLPPPYEDPVEQKQQVRPTDSFESPDSFVKTLDAPDAGLVDDRDTVRLGGPASTRQDIIGDEFEPFADPADVAHGSGTDGLGRGARELIPDDDDLIGSGYETGAEHDVMEGHSVADHVPTEKDYFKPPQVAETIPEDWSTEFGAGAAPAGSPPAAPQGAAGAPSHPAAAPVAFGPSDIASARAFLAGAGMEGLDVTDQELEQLMRTVGATFRQMVEGMREVLMTRTSIKSEFRIDQTMLKAKENNPLKFSTSGEEAMKALLHKPAAGYMPAERAVQEGFEDIRAHQLAVMAGLQVALTALLKRFDPETLAKRLEKSSLLSSKKAQYWDLFTKLYQEIAREAEDDFQSLFGREFSRAYKEQVKKL